MSTGQWVASKTDRPEGSCGVCAWKPIGTHRCLKKDRPVQDDGGCLDDFKPRVSAKKKDADKKDKKSKSKKDVPFDDEFDQALETMLKGADKVKIYRDDFVITIKKRWNDER
jgi:hypothetical protein